MSLLHVYVMMCFISVRYYCVYKCYVCMLEIYKKLYKQIILQNEQILEMYLQHGFARRAASGRRVLQRGLSILRC